MARTSKTSRKTMNSEHYTAPYMDGSTAVAYDRQPEQVPFYEQPLVQEPRPSKKRASVNPVYTLVLVSLVFLMLLICVMILKAQFTVAATSDRVIELKQELTAIRRENAHLESIIHEELDLVAIKEVAMMDYGMVYPTDSDVIRIHPVASGYTVQYASVEAPIVEKASVGNVLAFITRGW